MNLSSFIGLIREDLRGALPRMGLLTLLGTLIGFFLAGTSQSLGRIPFYITRNNPDGPPEVLLFETTILSDIFPLVFLPSLILVALFSWFDYRRQDARMVHLMRPTSQATKWMSRWVVVGLIFPLLFMLYYVGGFMSVIKMISQRTPSTGFAPFMYSWQWLGEIWAIGALAQGFFFWLSLRFPKWSALAAILLLIVWKLILIVFGKLGLQHMTALSSDQLQYVTSHFIYGNNFPLPAKALGPFLWVTLGPLWLWMSWMVFRNKQMV